MFPDSSRNERTMHENPRAHTLARTCRSRAILVLCGACRRGLKCLVLEPIPLIVDEDGGNTAHALEETVQHLGCRPRVFRK